MAPISKQHANSIARKLKARIDTSGKAHDIAYVYDDKGTLLASFGIRRGSKRSLGHGHIPNDLGLNRYDTLRLANCPMSREEWVQRRTGDDEIDEEEEVGDE
jgi:hypothetical protein